MFTLLLSLIATVTFSDNIGHHVLLSDAAKQYGAVCLDGTPGAYYFANGTETTKYVIFFQGGGWCSGLYKSFGHGMDSCWARHTKASGTTKNDAQTLDMNQHAYLGDNQTTNPLFYNWNKVYLRYCDGASFGGNVNDPIPTNNATQPFLYYRGKRIVDAIFNSLSNDYGLKQATDVVIGGGSAGGLAAFNHINYVSHNFLDLSKMKVVGLPDVGYFIEYNGWNGMTNWSNAMEWVYNNQNVSSSLYDIEGCYNDKTLIASECIFAQNMARYSNVPLFVLNSQYDEYQASSILGTGTSNATLLNEYGKNFTKLLIADLLNYSDESKGIVFGAYIDSCYHHDAEDPDYWIGLDIDGYTQATAFSQFYAQLDSKQYKRTFWYENTTYPCTSCCPKTTYYEAKRFAWQY